MAGLLRTLRCRNDNRPGILGALASALGKAGANLGDIRTVSVGPQSIVRDLDLLVERLEDLDHLSREIEALEGVELLEVIDDVHDFHLDGKLEVRPRRRVESVADLRRAYTPGVAEVVQTLADDPEEAWLYSIRGNTVAIVTNGTRVLGLGNVGPIAALPVMEGKAALIHQFGGLSAFPIVLDEREPDAIVETVKRIAPGFAAIHLEDIESPVCFEVEARLIEALDMPVFHDDQHGTAVAALAATTNAVERAGLSLEAARVGVLGLGAAGSAIARMLDLVSEQAVLGFDPSPDARSRLEAQGGEAAADMDDLLARADVLVAVSGRRDLIRADQVRRGQVILALTNPHPEIDPEVALEAGAAFAADGRSVNNLLGFPGILRGSVDSRATRVTRSMYLAAARVIAAHAGPRELVPNPLRPDVHRAVARAVGLAAMEAGVARAEIPADYLETGPFHTLRGSEPDTPR